MPHRWSNQQVPSVRLISFPYVFVRRRAGDLGVEGEQPSAAGDGDRIYLEVAFARLGDREVPFEDLIFGVGQTTFGGQYRWEHGISEEHHLDAVLLAIGIGAAADARRP